MHCSETFSKGPGRKFAIGFSGKYAVKLLNGKGSILEISGLERSSPAADRHKGFVQEISKFPGIKIVNSLPGKWETNVVKK